MKVCIKLQRHNSQTWTIFAVLSWLRTELQSRSKKGAPALADVSETAMANTLCLWRTRMYSTCSRQACSHFAEAWDAQIKQAQGTKISIMFNRQVITCTSQPLTPIWTHIHQASLINQTSTAWSSYSNHSSVSKASKRSDISWTVLGSQFTKTPTALTRVFLKQMRAAKSWCQCFHTLSMLIDEA